MTTRKAHIRHGFAAVRPYLHGHLDLADFVRHVFGAVEIERVEVGPKSIHIESQIGDSVVVLETGSHPILPPLLLRSMSMSRTWMPLQSRARIRRRADRRVGGQALSGARGRSA